MICGIYFKVAGPTDSAYGNHAALGVLTPTPAVSKAMSRSFPGGNLRSQRVFLVLSQVALYVGVLVGVRVYRRAL